MNLRPKRGQLIVLPDPPQQQIGLIVLPDVVKADNPNYFTETGVVVAVSESGSVTEDGEDSRPFDVQVGERVHFNRYAGKQITAPDDNVIYLIMYEKEIDMVIGGGHAILHGYQGPADAGVASYDRDPFADKI